MSASIQPGAASFLRVRDLQACSEFYKTVFGSSALPKGNGSAGVQLPGGAVLVLIGDRPESGQARPFAGSTEPERTGPQHIRLPIALSSPEAWERRLFLSGVPIEKWSSGGTDGQDGTTICFRDVEGNLLELSVF